MSICFKRWHLAKEAHVLSTDQHCPKVDVCIDFLLANQIKQRTYFQCARSKVRKWRQTNPKIFFCSWGCLDVVWALSFWKLSCPCCSPSLLFSLARSGSQTLWIIMQGHRWNYWKIGWEAFEFRAKRPVSNSAKHCIELQDVKKEVSETQLLEVL